MIPRADICVKFYLSAELYLALRHRAASEDRSISQHLRHLLRVDLLKACDDLGAIDRAPEGAVEGQAGDS